MTKEEKKPWQEREEEAKTFFCKHSYSDARHSGIARIVGYIPEQMDEPLDPESTRLLIAETAFGDRADKKETYDHWSARTERALRDCYKCYLTKDYCTAREKYMHFSEIVEGDHWNVEVYLAHQQRCPAYIPHSSELRQKLEKIT